MIKYFVLLFSFTLGLGNYDPIFGQESTLDLTTIFGFSIILISFFSKDFFTEIEKIKKPILILLVILFIFFISGISYGYANNEKSIFNIKFLICIVLFGVLAYTFKNNLKLCFQSLMVFSISCASLALFSYFGLLGNSYEVINDRALLFGENPNSTSTRMALALLYFFYILIQDPLKYRKLRYLVLMAFFPLLMAIVLSGSRGSLFSLIIGIVILVMFSKIKKYTKVFLACLMLIGFFFIINYLSDNGIKLDRFNSFIEEGNTGGRQEIWLVAMDIFYDYPFFGAGEAGYFDEILHRYLVAIDTHNLFIYLLVCGGIFSFLLFVWFMIILFKNVIVNYKNKEVLPLIFFCFIILLAAKTGGVLTYLIMWYLFAIIFSFNKYDDRNGKSKLI
jgi:O-antigen ligase